LLWGIAVSIEPGIPFVFLLEYVLFVDPLAFFGPPDFCFAFAALAFPVILIGLDKELIKLAGFPSPGFGGLVPVPGCFPGSEPAFYSTAFTSLTESLPE